MIKANKLISGVTGAGAVLYLAAQGLGTFAGISYFDHLSEMSTVNNSNAAFANSQFQQKLNDPKYTEIVKDSYFSSSDFVNKIEKYQEGDDAYQLAVDSVLSDTEKEIVDVYPATSFSFNELKKTLERKVPLDIETFNKWRVVKDAEDSCKVDSKISDPAAVSLGKKYFCP